MKLIKTDNVYNLRKEHHLVGSSDHSLIDDFNNSDGTNLLKLSIKNCQAIERGYDLEELAISTYPFDGKADVINAISQQAYIKGFEKALEILGDKKFIVEDMMRAYNQGGNDGASCEAMCDHYDNIETIVEAREYGEKCEEDFKKSLQQTEWNVEFETDEIDTSNVKEGNLNYDDTGRAYPDNPDIKENWSAIWKNDGKFYRIINLPYHGEWEEITGIPKLDSDGHPILKRQI